MRFSLTRMIVAPLVVLALISTVAGEAAAQQGGRKRIPDIDRGKPLGGSATANGAVEDVSEAPDLNPNSSRPPQPMPAARKLGVYSQAVRLSNGQVAVQITSVIAGTAAAREQFDPGDIIVSANGYYIQSPDQLRWAVANSGGTLNMWIINIRTGGYQQMRVSL